jgi:poly(3-hydroxybutyrate) depolymerase
VVRCDRAWLAKNCHVASEASKARAVGPVMALGRYCTPHAQEQLTHYHDVADAHGFVVVYPDGVEKNWADGRSVSEPDRRGIDDVGFIAALAGKLIGD